MQPRLLHMKTISQVSRFRQSVVSYSFKFFIQVTVNRCNVPRSSPYCQRCIDSIRTAFTWKSVQKSVAALPYPTPLKSLIRMTCRLQLTEKLIKEFIRLLSSYSVFPSSHSVLFAHCFYYLVPFWNSYISHPSFSSTLNNRTPFVSFI